VVPITVSSPSTLLGAGYRTPYRSASRRRALQLATNRTNDGRVVTSIERFLYV
jgi:hypothetical protein